MEQVEEIRPLRLCLFGAAGDTGNQGVSALLHSTLGGIARFTPRSEVTVFDHGWGLRTARANVGGRLFEYQLCGARFSRRFHRPESFFHMRISSRLGGFANAGARAILHANAVWDISGGDSFSDLYGARHLRAVVAPKRLALARGIPLVLLPQTYGPFTTATSQRMAAAILRSSLLAWTRDEESLSVVRELLGSDYDPARHRLGVDVSFGLQARKPAGALPEPLSDWIATRSGPPTVGINVSGLLFNDPAAARKYDLTADYARAMRLLLKEFLQRTEARVVLVPHVLPPPGYLESDGVACRRLREELSREERRRVALLPESFDASETKWIVSKLTWFSGARMHACIGALSTSVPSGGVAYSVKMRGVFETCGQGRYVADLRTAKTEGLVADLWRAWEERDQARAVLAEKLPGVIARGRDQLLETLRVSAQ